VNQEAFQARHEPQWRAFEHWLDAAAASRRRGNAAAGAPAPPLRDEAVPHCYRVLCQHLALARDRQYSAGLVERLNALVMRGHQVLYGARSEAGPAVARFFAADLAHAVRRQWRAIALAAALMFLPLAGAATAVQHAPDLAQALIGQDQIEDIERMYDPAKRRTGQRAAQTDALMFGYYIWNNVRIGFQSFAGGLLFGLGSMFFLVFNGVAMGAAAGHLIQAGFATPFFGFVAGHSAFELTGIVLMGAAGLLLGRALLMPGPFARLTALRLEARAAVPLVCGGGALLVCAAGVEAFWSPLTQPAPLVKYAVGIALWLALGAYFVFAGRSHAD
jgi:uncharacterized membrane protein SpoIIM required for sporulation